MWECEVCFIYIQDLTAALRDELSGLFEDLCVALVTEPLQFDVRTFSLLVQVNLNQVSHILLRFNF